MNGALFMELRIATASRPGVKALRFIRVTPRLVYISKVYALPGGVSERGGVEVITHGQFAALKDRWGEAGAPDDAAPVTQAARRQLVRTMADAVLDGLD